jgi:hypothetical protein
MEIEKTPYQGAVVYKCTAFLLTINGHAVCNLNGLHMWLNGTNTAPWPRNWFVQWSSCFWLVFKNLFGTYMGVNFNC